LEEEIADRIGVAVFFSVFSADVFYRERAARFN